MASSIVRIPCICHKVAAGKERRTCFLISLNPETAGMANIIDRSFFGGPDVAQFENIDAGTALNFIRYQEEIGSFHSIWTFGTPFAACLVIAMIRDVLP
jgi:hypothetical protein